MMSKSGVTFYPRLDFRSRSGTLCRPMSSLGGRNFSLTSHAARKWHQISNRMLRDDINYKPSHFIRSFTLISYEHLFRLILLTADQHDGEQQPHRVKSQRQWRDISITEG